MADPRSSLYRECLNADRERRAELKSGKPKSRKQFYHEFEKTYREEIIKAFREDGYFEKEFFGIDDITIAEYFTEWAEEQGFEVSTDTCDTYIGDEDYNRATITLRLQTND